MFIKDEVIALASTFKSTKIQKVLNISAERCVLFHVSAQSCAFMGYKPALNSSLLSVKSNIKCCQKDKCTPSKEKMESIIWVDGSFYSI